MLKFTFNALIQQLLLQKHHPTMLRTATVRPKRSGPNILYNTSLTQACIRQMTKNKPLLLRVSLWITQHGDFSLYVLTTFS